MKMLIALILLWSTTPVSADMGAIGELNKVIDTSWMKQQTLKWGFVGSLCTYQALAGMKEGYHWSQETKHIINDDNYHAFVTMKDIAGLTTGWMAYANYRDADLGKIGKMRRLLGALCYGRNIREWSYKAQRYGNPFDYSTKRNEHSIVYFEFRRGKLVDAYIGTGPVSGPAVDISLMIIGFLLMK